MSAATQVAPAPLSTEPQPADVFVIFGITGDLAKVMTFRSLYRLEQRGLLDCPIVGVAVDDWSVDQLVAAGTRRRSSAPASSSTRRCSSASRSGSRTCRATSATRPPTSALPTPSPRPRAPSSTSRSRRSSSAGSSRASPRQALTKNAQDRRREAVRPRPRVGARARRGAPPVHRRVAALPHRPLPREDGPRGDPLPPVREPDLRAGLEPRPHRVRRDHDGRGLRRRGSRPLLRSRRRAARRRRQPPDAGGRRHGDGAAVPRRPATIKDSQVALFRAVLEADPAHYVRGQYEGYLGIDGVAADSTTETYAALRLEIENWRWSGVPFFIRTGKRLPVTQTEVRVVFKHPPRLGFGIAFLRAEPDRRQARPVHRHPGDPRGAPGRRPGRLPDRARHGVRRRGRRGRDAVRGAPPRRDGRRRHALHPTGRRRGGVADHAAAPRRAAAGARVRARLVGPRGGRQARSRLRPLARTRGSRHERRRRPVRRSARRARRRRRRSRRSPTTRSCRTATPARSSRPTGRSTGSAFPPSTRRASSAACSTGRRGSCASGRTASTIPRRGTTSRGRTCS